MLIAVIMEGLRGMWQVRAAEAHVAEDGPLEQVDLIVIITIIIITIIIVIIIVIIIIIIIIIMI